MGVSPGGFGEVSVSTGFGGGQPTSETGYGGAAPTELVAAAVCVGLGLVTRMFSIRRALRGAALPGIVGVSMLLHWLAARRLHGLWIMPDEAIYAERSLAFWRHGTLPLLHGQGAGYGVLYPIIAGLPLSRGGFAYGDALLKIVQALAVSLAAVPVYLYGRRIMRREYALLAAALTVASPLLLYSGLVMTEVLFYPLAALALLAVANAVATATLGDQWVALALVGVALLVRVQAVVFVLVFALAVLVDTLLRRERSRLRSFMPLWLVLAACTASVALAPGVFGSYAGTLRGSYPLGRALTLGFDHLSYLALSTGVIPSLALVLLVLEAVRGREHEPRARALLVVTACASLLIIAQVGFFAARYAPHLLGRDLASLPPLLFLTLALWASRGAPRAVVGSSLAAFGLLCVLLLAPWNRLADASAVPDTFEIDLLQRLHGLSPVDAVTVGSLCALALALALPRRLALLLPLLVGAALTTSSVIVSKDIAGLVEQTQTAVVGSPPDWIDRAVQSPVAYLYDGEAYWNGVWQERFWNPRIDHVYDAWPAAVPGPMPQAELTIPNDGRLSIAERYIVATDPHVFVGTPIAHLALFGSDTSGLTLWRLKRPARLSLVEQGVQPNGDITDTAIVNVYDCQGGQLELTLLPKATHLLRILLDGRLVLERRIDKKPVWHGTLHIPASRTSRNCTFTIEGQSLLGSTRIAFAPSP